MNLLSSVLKLASITLDTIFVAPVVAATAVVDERAAYRICQGWAWLNTTAFGVRVRSRRLAALDPHGAYVFMSNHRSNLDVLAVIVALHEYQLRWVAKVELTRVPVFGWALRRAGHIIIDRGNTTQAVLSLRHAVERLQSGISIMIFPEGTRSRDGQDILPFKKGGFMMALETGFPIVPLAIRGSRPLLPKGSWQVRGGDIEVIVGAPIPVAGVDRDELMRRVRAFMLEHLGPCAADVVTAEAS